MVRVTRLMGWGFALRLMDLWFELGLVNVEVGGLWGGADGLGLRVKDV